MLTNRQKVFRAMIIIMISFVLSTMGIGIAFGVYKSEEGVKDTDNRYYDALLGVGIGAAAFCFFAPMIYSNSYQD